MYTSIHKAVTKTTTKGEIKMETYIITNRFFGSVQDAWGCYEQYGLWGEILVKRVGCSWIRMDDGKALYGKYEYKA
jgi:hypothetical protein